MSNQPTPAQKLAEFLKPETPDRKYFLAPEGFNPVAQIPDATASVVHGGGRDVWGRAKKKFEVKAAQKEVRVLSRDSAGRLVEHVQGPDGETIETENLEACRDALRVQYPGITDEKMDEILIAAFAKMDVRVEGEEPPALDLGSRS